uniref:Uncharacterized protein n=1 Tax=Anguilla anguilla TaxID=7936 RepID=A0A0E9SMI6_ANGAN
METCRTFSLSGVTGVSVMAVFCTAAWFHATIAVDIFMDSSGANVYGLGRPCRVLSTCLSESLILTLRSCLCMEHTGFTLSFLGFSFFSLCGLSVS